MSVILSSMLIVLGSYIIQPDWFDDGPYKFESKHANLEECQIVTYGTDDICVGDEPSLRYVRSE